VGSLLKVGSRMDEGWKAAENAESAEIRDYTLSHLVRVKKHSRCRCRPLTESTSHEESCSNQRVSMTWRRTDPLVTARASTRNPTHSLSK